MSQIYTMMMSLPNFSNVDYRASRVNQMIDLEFEKIIRIIKDNETGELKPHIISGIMTGFIKIKLIYMSVKQASFNVLRGNELYIPDEYESLRYANGYKDADDQLVVLNNQTNELFIEIENKYIEITEYLTTYLSVIEDRNTHFIESVDKIIVALIQMTPYLLNKIFDDEFFKLVINYQVDNIVESFYLYETSENLLFVLHAIYSLGFSNINYRDQLEKLVE